MEIYEERPDRCQGRRIHGNRIASATRPPRGTRNKDKSRTTCHEGRKEPISPGGLSLFSEEMSYTGSTHSHWDKLSKDARLRVDRIPAENRRFHRQMDIDAYNRHMHYKHTQTSDSRQPWRAPFYLTVSRVSPAKIDGSGADPNVAGSYYGPTGDDHGGHRPRNAMDDHGRHIRSFSIPQPAPSDGGQALSLPAPIFLGPRSRYCNTNHMRLDSSTPPT